MGRKIWSCATTLFKSRSVEIPTLGVITYSMLMLYDSIPIQLVICYGGDPTFALNKIDIHMFVSFVIASSSTCDSMFAQFNVWVLLLQNIYTNFLH
jgi:hypothetical protein